MAIHTYGLPAAADTLGRRITQARGFARVTQGQLVQAVGVSRRTLSSWEHDRTAPSVPQLLRLAKVTGFPPSWFIDGLDEVGDPGTITTRRYSASDQPELPFPPDVIDLRDCVTGRGAVVTGRAVVAGFGTTLDAA